MHMFLWYHLYVMTFLLVINDSLHACLPKRSHLMHLLAAVVSAYIKYITTNPSINELTMATNQESFHGSKKHWPLLKRTNAQEKENIQSHGQKEWKFKT